MQSLNQTIASGDWDTLRCSYNGIAKCLPNKEPILIVREFLNFEEKSRLELFQSLEGMKEGKFKFPMILETSDFLWVLHQSVIKLSHSFCSYTMKEMTRDEGREELVNKYKMWTQEEFDKVFEALGGHTGSYQMLRSAMMLNNLNLDEGIQRVKDMSYNHLFICMRGIDDTEIFKLFLCKLKANNYEQHFEKIPDYVSHLIRCNLLFLKEKNVVSPQKHLLQHAIESYITDFVVNCSSLL